MGWLIIFTEALSTATVALGFSGYFRGLFGVPTLLSSITLIILLSVLNFIGIRESSRLNILFTAIEASGLMLIILLGLPRLGRVDFLETPTGLSGILRASTLVFFAYLGFEDIVNLAEESKDPERQIPKALILSVLITAVLYVLVAVSTVSLADWRQLGASEGPLAFAASRALGENAYLVMSYIALFATANTVLILLIVTSRMIFGMARDGSLPKLLSKIHSKRGTPWIAILVSMLLSIFFVSFSNLEFVAGVTNFGTFITFATVNLVAIWLRYKRPEMRRPFKTPAIGKFPIVPVIGLFSCALMITQFGPNVLISGLSILGVGVALQKLLSMKDENEAGPS